MFKKNSIFIKVLIPVIIVMLFQTLLISMVLFVNGTIKSLGDSAIDSLRKDTANRGDSLEDMMNYYWSNIDKLESDIEKEISGYLSDKNISISKALGDYSHETAMLDRLSDSLLATLRMNSSTGVFIYFLNDQLDHEGSKSFNGLYYRDLNPVSTPADYSDILFYRGFINIARNDNIQLDSLWNELFIFSPEYPDHWKSYSEPVRAALEFPRVSSLDLSYWSMPIYYIPGSTSEVSGCITYSRPFFYNGKLVAIIGSEVQISHIEKYFPSSDFENSGKSGYMLLSCIESSLSGSTIDCGVSAVTGSYIGRIFESETMITLAPAERKDVYSVVSDDAEDMQLVMHPLRIYNTNTPFSSEKWFLAGIAVESALFESSVNVGQGIVLSSFLALLIGSVLIAFIIRLSTKPFFSIASQIEHNEFNDQIQVPETDTYEILLLCSTINAMKDKREKAEARVREERERYLVALESAADTFLEYDIAQDSFMLYYFSADGYNQLCSKIISDFMENIYSNEYFHSGDIENLISFFRSEDQSPIEVRAKSSLFSHISAEQTDDGYLWFTFKASHIHDSEGNATKIIGTAKEITSDKLLEFARIEFSHRDLTTGLYNLYYGARLIMNRITGTARQNEPYYLCLIRIDNIDSFEAYYGRVFAGVILMLLSRRLGLIVSEQDVLARLSNNEIIILFKSGKESLAEKTTGINRIIKSLYVGENTDLKLNAGIGLAFAPKSKLFDDLIHNARLAADYAQKTGGARFYDELPAYIKADGISVQIKPINVFLEITKETSAAITYELFERTSDTRSAVNMLLALLGELYGLCQIIIFTYDTGFEASKVSYQWCGEGVARCSEKIEKLPQRELSELESILDENGAFLYSVQDPENGKDVAKRLLRISAENEAATLCCVFFENGAHMGRILFKSQNHELSQDDPGRLSLTEITKIIAARLSIEKSNSASRAKSEFLSRVSHEIRTPMSAIIGMSNIAQNSVDQREILVDCLQKIDYSAKHLLSIINDVLDMSRIESGKLQIENAPFLLSELIRGIDTLMRPPIEGDEKSFSSHRSVIHDMVVGDEHRLRQVLVNLIGNSNKFTHPGGSIEFSVNELDSPCQNAQGFGLFRFSVKDSGIGISKEDQHSIFKAFEQANSSSTAQKRQGTGLGLAISGSIIAAMGSKIDLISSPGQGSEFYFTLKLPLRSKRAHTELPEDETSDYTDYFKGKRALLVEDNEINIEIAAYILMEAGFEIETARNGLEAVQMFNKSAAGYYDVIFMDIQMPVMDGLEAASKIRKSTPRTDASSVPIIALSANAFDDDTKKSIESGMNGHIAKPIDSLRLYEMLAHLLGGKENDDEKI